TRTTAALATIFFLLSLGMGMYLSHHGVTPNTQQTLGVMAGAGSSAPASAPATSAPAASAAAPSVPAQQSAVPTVPGSAPSEVPSAPAKSAAPASSAPASSGPAGSH
ncbi:MAG TPA: preprotein translocase subunit SecG, partial [Rhodanobacteraceae bacterium]|nr:preprotein translocase subunit SecG [Rhodanobacteraceae bacterium]